MPQSSAIPRAVVAAVCYTLGPIGAAVVLLWVGLWGLLDTYLFPEDVTLSGAICIGFATLLAMICHAWTFSSISTDTVVYVFLTASVGVCFWRGVWKLWESLVFVDIPLIQSLLAISLGTGILVLSGNFQPTVVGPPILFPRSQTDNSSLAPNELTSPLHDDYNEEERMIAMIDVIKGNAD
jgi:hypothetical protein